MPSVFRPESVTGYTRRGGPASANRHTPLLLLPVLILAAALASHARAERPIPGVNRSPFGAQTVWPITGDYLQIMNAMQGAGIQWGRCEICWWGLCESTPGVYNFTSATVAGYPNAWDADRQVSLLRARNIEPYGILCYSNALYDNNQGPSTDAAREAFGNYCHAAAARYRDTVYTWEIWNEPNLEFFWGRPANAVDYARLAVVAAARIREANPDAIVVGAATSGVDLAFLGTAFDNGLLGAVDAISIHPYRIAAPESVNSDIAAVRALIDEHTTRTVAIWSGEWGYNTAWSEVTDLGQAKCLARMMVNNLSKGIELSIWFSTHPFAEIASAPEDPQWGLVDYSYTPRPSWHAFKTINDRLAAPVRWVADPFATEFVGTTASKRYEIFARDSPRRFTAAVWMPRWPLSDTYTGRTGTLSFQVPQGTAFQAWDGLTGDAVPLTVGRSGDRATLSDFRLIDYPIYIDITLPDATPTPAPTDTPAPSPTSTATPEPTTPPTATPPPTQSADGTGVIVR